MASQCLTRSDLRWALGGVAACARAAQTAAPPLGAMVASCDPDLFLVLPRIAWLGFLSAPHLNGPLIEHVLPELYPEPRLRGSELQALAKDYNDVIEQIAWAVDDDGVDTGRRASGGTAGGIQLADQGARKRALNVLLQRAVLGRTCQPGGLPSGLPFHVSAPAEALLQNLEGWSMRLQRRQPDFWNELSAVLVQCLSGDACDESAGSGDSFDLVD